MIGATIRKLRDDASGAAVSPDGNSIIFTSADMKQVLAMGIDGQNVRTLFSAAQPNIRFAGVSWSPDGRRITDVTWRIGSSIAVLESRDSNGANPVELVKGSDLIGGVDLPNGRMLLSRTEPPPHSEDSNLWELKVDDRGRPKGRLKRFTDWVGFRFVDLSTTADGKQLVFSNGREQADVSMGDIDARSGAVKNVARLTMDERQDWPGDWTRDSSRVLFHSNRNGVYDLYRQGPQDRGPEVIWSSAEHKWGPQLTPDGKWILYFSRSSGSNAAIRVMRVSATGGAPEVLADVRGVAPSDNIEAAMNTVDLRCPQRSDRPCVVQEMDGDAIVFSTLDPVRGRLKELYRTSLPPMSFGWGLSPEGTRVAYSEMERERSIVHLIPVDGGAQSEFPVKGWVRTGVLAWTADGTALYAGSYSSRGTSLLRIDLKGDAKLIYQTPWVVPIVRPSPDGRRIALGVFGWRGNLWRIPDLPKD